MGYRRLGATEWTESVCPLAATGTAVIDVVSGDGGSTQQNGAATVKFDRFQISRAADPISESLSDEFNGPAVDVTKWTNNGYAYSGATTIGTASIDANGIAQFPALSALNTERKVTFTGSKIVAEARMAGTGFSRDTRIMLVDAANPLNFVIALETNYCGWGMAVSGSGAYELQSGAYECGGSNKVRHFGTSINQFMEYRLTIEGSSVLLERGPTLASIYEKLTATLTTSMAGKPVFLTIGTVDPNYSPGSFDWVRITSRAFVDHLATPATDDNAGSGSITFGQLFTAVSDRVSGVTFYLGDPARPGDSRVDALTGVAQLRLYEVDVNDVVTLLATKAVNGANAVLEGQTTFHFDAPIRTVPGGRYFIGIQASDNFGLGLRDISASTYDGGAEAWIAAVENRLTLHSTRRDTSFRVLANL